MLVVVFIILLDFAFKSVLSKVCVLQTIGKCDCQQELFVTTNQMTMWCCRTAAGGTQVAPFLRFLKFVSDSAIWPVLEPCVKLNLCVTAPRENILTNAPSGRSAGWLVVLEAACVSLQLEIIQDFAIFSPSMVCFITKSTPSCFLDSTNPTPTRWRTYPDADVGSDHDFFFFLTSLKLNLSGNASC